MGIFLPAARATQRCATRGLLSTEYTHSACSYFFSLLPASPAPSPCPTASTLPFIQAHNHAQPSPPPHPPHPPTCPENHCRPHPPAAAMDRWMSPAMDALMSGVPPGEAMAWVAQPATVWTPVRAREGGGQGGGQEGGQRHCGSIAGHTWQVDRYMRSEVQLGAGGRLLGEGCTAFDAGVRACTSSLTVSLPATAEQNATRSTLQRVSAWRTHPMPESGSAPAAGQFHCQGEGRCQAHRHPHWRLHRLGWGREGPEAAAAAAAAAGGFRAQRRRPWCCFCC